MAFDPLVRTYDPKMIIATFGGIPFTGFMDGTFLTIEKNGPSFEGHKGADGTIDRVNKNEYGLYTVTITLKQTSITNDLLTAVWAGDRLANTGILPILIKDLRGLSLFFAEQAWISEDPNDEFSDAISSRQWMFQTGRASKVTGGNL